MILSKIARVITVLVAIVTGITTVSGVLWNLYEFANYTKQKTKAAQISQLTSYKTFGELLTHYRKIELKTDMFMRTNVIQKLNLNYLIDKYKTGSSIYYSEELNDYREIREFYEELGVLIRFDAIDFNLVFQLITFPSDFYEATKQLQEFIGEHWFELRKEVGKRKLKDFGFNMDQLASNYELRRNRKPTYWANP